MRRVTVTLLDNEPDVLLLLLDIAEYELAHRLTLPADDGYDHADIERCLGHLDYIAHRIRDAMDAADA